MQTLGGENMALDAPEQRLQHGAASPDLIGESRQAERHSFPSVAFGLTVQRLVLPELLKQQHGEEMRPGPAARRDVERRRRLADLLAIPAGHLLAHMLDHLPLARDHLQRLGDGLAELPQPCAAAARACRRSRHDDTLSRQMGGERLSGRALARKGGDRCRLRCDPLSGDLVLGGGRFQLRELQLHLVEDARRALRARSVDLASELGDLELLLGDHRRIVGRLGAGHRQLCLQCLECLGLRIHATRESQTLGCRPQNMRDGTAYPARSGRNV